MKYLYISILLLVLGYFQILNPVRDITQHIFAPFQFGLRNIALDINGVAQLFSGVEKLRQENIRLVQENMNLNSQLVELKNIAEENDTLRQQLGLKNEFKKELLMATVMGNASDLTGSSFIIDRGSSDGVKAGDNIVLGNYLIGIVREVGAYRSVANFVSSSSVAVAAMDIDVPGQTEGVAEGQYGSSIIMRQILPNEEIKVGDRIVTSGKDGVFVPGLLVGKVTELVEIPTETLKSVYLETFVELSKIRKVFVLTN